MNGALAPAQGTDRVITLFQWASAPSGGWALLALVGAAGVTACVAWAYARERAGRLRWAPFALRICLLYVIALILLGPSTAIDLRRVVPGHVVMLVDRSASMSVRDAGEGQSASRHELLRRLLAPATLAALTQRAEVRLVTFASATKEVLTLPYGAEAVEPKFPEWEATGAYTDIRAALHAALGPSDGTPLAGVVLLSDGIDTAGSDGAELARQAAGGGIPIHAIAFGSSNPLPNVRVVGLRADGRALAGLPLRLTATVASEGLGGREVTLLLAASGTDGDSREVLRRAVVLGEGEAVKTLDLTHVPPAGGLLRYEARVEPLEGEARLEDNVGAVQVQVSEQKVRVLLVGGVPSREFRFLRELIRRDPTFELDVWLSTSSASPPLPQTRSELLRYAVVLACDPARDDVEAEWWSKVVQLVDREGLGLVYVAGPAHAPDLLTGRGADRLLNALPVLPDRARLLSLISGGGYFTRLLAVTAAANGAEHPVLAPADASAPLAYWRQAPGLYWTCPTVGAKQGATVLLRAGQHVLAAVQPYGMGRVLWCGSPETWRWRRAGIQRHERFWLQALRHAAGGVLVADRRVRISLDRSAYLPGQVVRVRVRVLDEAMEPVAAPEVVLSVERDGAAVRKVSARPVVGKPGTYEALFTPPRFGSFRVVHRVPGGPVVAEGFEVKRPEVEFRRVRPDIDLLTRMTRQTGGILLRPDEIGRLTEVIPDLSRTVVEPGPVRPAWDRAWLLGLIIVLLAGEWVLRKGLGML